MTDRSSLCLIALLCAAASAMHLPRALGADAVPPLSSLRLRPPANPSQQKFVHILGASAATAPARAASGSGRTAAPATPPRLLHPSPFPRPPSLSPAQKAAEFEAKQEIQAIFDKMDRAVRERRAAGLLAHRDPAFAAVDVHGVWRSATDCRADVGQLFARLTEADKRSVVQAITVNGSLAEVYVSRHGVVHLRQAATASRTVVDAVCRDIFRREGDRWMQYRSYTLAEQVYVDGKHVPS